MSKPTRPQPPPVYRPQPVPKVLQTKRAISEQRSPLSPKPQPVAPAVYRPQPTPKVLQRKEILQPSSAGVVNGASGRLPNRPEYASPALRVNKVIQRHPVKRAAVIQRAVNPNPAAPITLATSLHPDSSYDFQVGGVGQTYYGGMDLQTGVIYLVPSVNQIGQAFTDPRVFRQQSITETHGNHMQPQSQVLQTGAGHLNALIMSNHYFNITSLKNDCAAFSITKTGSGTFNFVGNSGINEMGSFTGHNNRNLPVAWNTFIQAQLLALVPQDLQPNKCVIV